MSMTQQEKERVAEVACSIWCSGDDKSAYEMFTTSRDNGGFGWTDAEYRDWYTKNEAEIMRLSVNVIEAVADKVES